MPSIFILLLVSVTKTIRIVPSNIVHPLDGIVSKPTVHTIVCEAVVYHDMYIIASIIVDHELTKGVAFHMF